MKAAVFRGVGVPLEVEDVEIDEPRAHEIVVRTGASGVCHSDLHYVEGKYTTRTPVVLGHEAAGTIEAVGDQVTYVKPGDHVITCLSVFCGHCERCLEGRMAICLQGDTARGKSDGPRLRQGDTEIKQFLNLSSFAEQMLVSENAAVKIRKDVPFEQLALIGCGATTGLGAALNTAQVKPGSTVAVVGCGGVGLSAIQGAALAGALRIIAVDTVETKLGLAQELGATDVVDASSGDVVERVMSLTGDGVDYSFEALGTKETTEQCYEMLRAGGTATIIGMIPEGTKIEIDGPSILDERRLQGSNMGSNRFRIDMPRYVEFYRQGRLKLDEMVTQRIGLEDVNSAFEDMNEGHVARSVITFD